VIGNIDIGEILEQDIGGIPMLWIGAGVLALVMFKGR
jgi:hypothetical protein